VLIPVVLFIPVGIPLPLSSIITELFFFRVTEIVDAFPLITSSIELSKISQIK
jgi:hypothetical protein